MKKWNFMVAVRLLLFLTIVLLAALPTSATAAGRDMIVRNTPTTVPQEQTLETLVVLNHDAKIEGKVTDVVFVYNGNVHLTSTSKTGVVVVLGGHVQQESGAVVQDGVATIAFDNALLNNSLLGLALVAGLWAVRLVFSILLIILPVLLSLVLRDRLEKPGEFLRLAMGRTGSVGLVVLVGGLGISFLLALSLIGAPLALLLVLVLLLLFAVGYTVLAYQVGKLIAGGRAFSNGVWRPTLLGGVAVVAFGNIPLFGGIMLLIVLVLSIGTSTVWFWQRRTRR